MYDKLKWVFDKIIILMVILGLLSAYGIIGDDSISYEEAERKLEYESEYESNYDYSQYEDVPDYVESDYISIYFINQGYYYHNNLNCEGLKDCYNINEITMSELHEYPHLNPCNWCVE